LALLRGLRLALLLALTLLALPGGRQAPRGTVGLRLRLALRLRAARTAGRGDSRAPLRRLL